MNRITKLLLKCAENLENGCDPLNGDFLVKHKITSDECFTLAEQMALAIKAYCKSSPMEKAIAIMTSMVDEAEGVTPEMARFTAAKLRVKEEFKDK